MEKLTFYSGSIEVFPHRVFQVVMDKAIIEDLLREYLSFVSSNLSYVFNNTKFYTIIPFSLDCGLVNGGYK